MRRKQWEKALANLQKAEKLMPRVAGIRLNIGLAYYRQNEFLKAIPAFESVVRGQPDAMQPRYLLGLCYFFAERWADADEDAGAALGAGIGATSLICMCFPMRPTGPDARNSTIAPAAQLIKVGRWLT